jgi:NAD(P)-dependent dehydrogenase (short-subunit alcohol dehydrogenase family)
VPTGLDDQTCVITGAGRGIGRVIAMRFAARGARLVLCSRSQAELERTAAEIVERHGVEVKAQPTDVTDIGALSELASRVARSGPAFALINCAAVLGPVGRIDQVDQQRWRDALTINLAGIAATCAAFVPQMIAGGGGSIVNLSGGGIGGPNLPGRISAYTSSKAGVAALTESLGEELAPLGIRVNAVAPGPVGTGFMREVLDAGPEGAGADLYRTTLRQQDVSEPSDQLLDLIEFVVSPESSPLTGKLLSARWDDLESLRTHVSELSQSSTLTLRRIDGTLYSEANSESESSR